MGKDTKSGETRKNTSISEDEKLDNALDHTFPASDPPSMTEPTKHVGSGKKTGTPSPVVAPK